MVDLKISVPFLVDLGSGLGHLPTRVMERLGTASSCTTSFAVESDSDLHSTALKMGMSYPHAEKRPIRIFTRVEKERLQQLMDQ